MSLQNVLVGALPDLEVQPVASKPHEQAKAKRQTRPRVEWSAKRIAAYIGISPSSLSKYLKQHEELRRILGRDGSKPRGDYGTTKEQVEAAAAFVLALPIWSWSLEHPACVRCKRTDSRHRGKGVCVRCHGLEAWSERGGGHVPYPGAWDTQRGHERCVVCHRNEKPHKCQGKCNACYRWWHVNGLDDRAKSEQRRLCAARRKVLRATRGGRRGVAVPALDGRRKNGEVTT